MKEDFSRREFIKTAGVITAMAALGDMPSSLFGSELPMATYPEKTGLLVLTSRPPQLETPMHLFTELITPNNALFVRWHLANIPLSVDLNEWRLKVGGNTGKELSLSMADLKKFEKISYTAVLQCAGNGRSFFEPRVPGGQWKNGAMGNITWTGARLRDILNTAGLKPGSVDVMFNGLDSGSLPSVPDFKKSLPVDKTLEEDIMVAYEMNGEPLTMLNGFPARIIVPGWYGTYWVKALSDITVLGKPFEEFWMKPAYRIPDNPCGCIPSGTTQGRTVPINRMTTRSLIITPSPDTTIQKNKPVEIMGVAFSGGYGIRDVIVSTDGGKTWSEARLGQDKGKYSWIQFSHSWRPLKTGKYTLMAKATNSIGDSQPFEKLWNPSGYLLNNVEKTEINVI
ncbi:MAG: twin-arginine translocation signal domain-containing protein [Nitrospirae bacterium]|nr:MAG: twin-arginine translocation signal domain-containing protein [Nitrospirota bacterium]